MSIDRSLRSFLPSYLFTSVDGRYASKMNRYSSIQPCILALLDPCPKRVTGRLKTEIRFSKGRYDPNFARLMSPYS